MWYSVTPEDIAIHTADRMTKLILSTRMKYEFKREETDESTKNAICSNSSRRNTIIILDVFCGCGGNSIAFARWNDRRSVTGDAEEDDTVRPRVKVIAVDNNLSRLKKAAHNASIYQVLPDDIVFIHADAVEILNHYCKGARKTAGIHDLETSYYAGYAIGGIDLLPNNIDGIFLSPPWGGMDYGNRAGKSGFDPVNSITVESCSASLPEAHQSADGANSEEGTSRMSVTTNGGELLSLATKAVFDDANQEGVVAYFLPRNIDGLALGKIGVASGIRGCFEMEQNVVDGKVKTVTAYFCSGLKEEMLQ